MNRERLIRFERLRLQPFALYDQYETFFCNQRNTLFTGPWPMKLTLSTPFRRKHHAKTK